MKKILVMNFFPAFCPPQSGGELRYYNMYAQLSRYYDVTLLSPTYDHHPREIIRHSETFREYRIPKESVHARLHAEIDRENICPEISALVCSLSAGEHNAYHDAYQELYPQADVIIHEFPYMLHYDLYFGLDDKPRIYNSHNFESKLVRQMWKGENAEKYLRRMHEDEGKLVRNCDLVFATSEEERTAFMETYGVDGSRIRLAPNGIDVALYEKLRDKRSGDTRKKAFFIGSAHPPNMEALRFICDRVAPSCPEVDFYIAGKCCQGQSCDLSNVKLMGLVDEEQKNWLFAESDVAINPMFSGAGTNLKTLEFLSAGVPMISTYVGVRGLDLREDEEYIHAEEEDFAARLRGMLNDPVRLESLAEKGKAYVNAVYSWEGICQKVHQEIEIACAGERAERAKPMLLFLNDYEADIPTAGGELRIYHLLSGLAKDFTVVFLSLNSQGLVKAKMLREDFHYFSFPKTAEHLAEEERVNSLYWISASDIVAGYMIRENALYMGAVQALASCAKALILEHPYMVAATDDLTDIPIIHESQNFETELKSGMLKGHPLYEELVAHIDRMERETLARASLVIACAEEEAPRLAELSTRKKQMMEVIRNGVSIPAPEYDYSLLQRHLRGCPLVTFVGSGHAPNVEAARFIIRELAPAVPEALFAIVGTVCGAFGNVPLPENVRLFGRLSDERKNFLLFSSTVAINPMEEGAGSNLKLAEYFAFRLPTVTTPFGARGYSVTQPRRAVVAERCDFAAAIRSLFAESPEKDAMIREAYDYACRELSWDGLASRYSALIRCFLSRKKKLLVVTYRWNDPPRGGAEVYMTKVLNAMARRGSYCIDIATTDMGDPQHRFHYSCDYTYDADVDVVKEEGMRCLKFPMDELDDGERWRMCHELYCNSMEETVRIARRFTQQYKEPLLMGGWHYPENGETGVRRWSSACAEIFVGGMDSIKLCGTVNRETETELLLDGVSVKKERLTGGFVLELDTRGGKVLTLQTDTFSVEGVDPRPLGLLITEIECVSAEIRRLLKLAYDYTTLLRSVCNDEYISALIDEARKRDERYNEMFYICRGPRSAALWGWLERNIDNYDVVLGHSTPFNTIIDAQKLAEKHGIPVVTLPHFHMEDTFYHWELYYGALNGSRCVIASPAASKKLFFEKIGAHVCCLPGGGIEPDEFWNVDDTAFKAAYPENEPFVLVLGRKAAAKNYRWVMEAVEKLRSQGKPISLVMVGRDDDGLPVRGDGITYLGEQPREVVLGALKNCRFVVNMSESESFGIVILEAWLGGKTILVNEGCAAFTELVEDGVNGVTTSRAELSEAIWKLWNAPEKADEMARCGAKKAADYTWERISVNIESLLDECLADNEIS